MPDGELEAGRPLLTIAVPTYNRAAELSMLLSYLQPQLAAHPEVELLIFDNASTHGTERVVSDFISKGMLCKYTRRPVNIGPDNNFLGCYEEARGRFVWIFGDDDVLFDGGLTRIIEVLRDASLDMAFVPAQGFVVEPSENLTPNPAAAAWVYSTPEDFLTAVNFTGDLALTTSVIVNKQRTESFAHPPYTEGADSNLLQLGWTFTCLLNLRRGAVFSLGLVATCEKAPSRPFDMARVFGKHWKQQAGRFLTERTRLYDTVLDQQLGAWFSNTWVPMRKQGYAANTPRPVEQMRADFGERLSFWFFVYPLLALPLRAAEAWTLVTRSVRSLQRRWFQRRVRRFRV